MRIFLDFFPLLLFFGAYKAYDIYVGTAVLMAGTVLQMAIIYRMDRKLLPLHKITLALILVFGALTLVLHDERFIKWKPTVLYAAMAIGLAVSVWGMRKDLLQMMLGSQLTLPAPVWHTLNVAWVLYCVFMAIINAYVVVNYSTEAWVSFKLWGYAFPFVFIVGQGLYIAPHIQSSEASDANPKP